jgi:hypothetical protein
MKMSGELLALAALSPGNRPVNPLDGSQADLDSMEKRKILALPGFESIPLSP